MGSKRPANQSIYSRRCCYLYVKSRFDLCLYDSVLLSSALVQIVMDDVVGDHRLTRKTVDTLDAAGNAHTLQVHSYLGAATAGENKGMQLHMGRNQARGLQTKHKYLTAVCMKRQNPNEPDHTRAACSQTRFAGQTRSLCLLQGQPASERARQGQQKSQLFTNDRKQRWQH